ncbi:MAG: hypothetical protein H7Y32_04360, partial [Chloroflexales bacterium]|nr:hypothetical protein [Chloroflexales bacterium]
MLEEAIAHYHSLLDPPMARASWHRLAAEMRAGRLYFGERPLATVLRPRMLTRDQYALVAHAHTRP